MQISKTKFGPNATIVQVNAVPASDKEDDLISSRNSVMNFVDKILERVEIPDRKAGSQKDFLFAIDHCFQIKG
jgi:translation elongation factor EF-Tu-like GTPase